MGTQPMSVNMREGQYSKLLAWEVWNFMSIKHAKAEFDDSNIVNIKGYNDSGKSAMLRALELLMFNIKPKSQCDFIQDGCEYTRIMAYFDDGVCILRDKYSNGQSLYELYKGDDVLFSTRQNGALTTVSAVPDVIAEYLGLIRCSDWNINSRSCFEKQLLVQTTGSENRRALDEVLRSEELALATDMINTDKNRVKSEIGVAETELEVYKRQIKDSKGVSKELLDKLREDDAKLDVSIAKLSSLGSCSATQKLLDEIPQIPELNTINASQLILLYAIKECDAQIENTPSIPEVFFVDMSRLTLLNEIKGVLEQTDTIPDIPQCSDISFDRLSLLVKIHEATVACQRNEDSITRLDEEQKEISSDLEVLQKQLDELGQKFIVCPNCGALVSSEIHSH